MQHLRWEKSSRTFIGDEPGQFVYKSSIGQQNVDLGNGQFAPYVWDKDKRIVKFADCELRFTASGLEFWHDTEKLNTLSFNPEYKQGANWKRRTLVPGSLSIQEIDPGNSKVELKISYKFITEDSETEVFVRAGYNHKVHFGTRFKALKDGVEQRIAIEFTGLFDPIQEYDRQGSPLPISRYKTAKSWWGWDRKEQIDHEIEQTTVTKIHLGRKVYALNEEKVISPDTWGTDVGIVADADDGYEIDNTTWDVDGYINLNLIGLGYVGIADPGNCGFRWDNITIAQGSTILTTLMDLYHQAEIVSGTCSGTFYAWDNDDAPIFSGVNRPSTVTKTTANVPWTVPTPGTAGWKTPGDLKSITQEIIDRAGWISGNAINFCLMNTSASGNICDFQDFSHAGTNEAELTITYTPGGGGDPLPMAMNHYRRQRS